MRVAREIESAFKIVPVVGAEKDEGVSRHSPPEPSGDAIRAVVTEGARQALVDDLGLAEMSAQSLFERDVITQIARRAFTFGDAVPEGHVAMREVGADRQGHRVQRRRGLRNVERDAGVSLEKRRQRTPCARAAFADPQARAE